MSAASIARAVHCSEAYLEQDDMPEAVADVFRSYPEEVRLQLSSVRGLIFEVAEEAGVGPLTETLKWGEPAYLTEATKAGSTVRLGVSEGRTAVFFICHTGLLDGFRADFPEALQYLGNRGVLVDDACDRDVLAICLTRALRYHWDKRELMRRA